MAPPRILLCGDVLGRLNQLFKRVSTVNKSTGPFDALLCVGQFFPDSSERLDELLDYVEGRSQVPIPTYFIGDYGIGAAKVLSAASNDSANRGFKMDGLKICDNLFWLKGSGKFTLHGLSVAYLSGSHSSDSQPIGVYGQDDIDALRAWAEEPGIVDLFLTNEWPSGVSNRADMSEAPPGISDSTGSDPILSELVAEIKPRYHIAGTKGVFYAREPYSNAEAVHVTRFLGLAPVGNKDKQKFIHAISPTPASTMSAAEICMKPPNTTLSPYTVVEKTVHAKEAGKRPSNSDSDTQYWRYDVSQKRQRQGGGDGEKLCFKFTSSGSCSRGEKCNFRHDMDTREQYLRGVCFDFLSRGKCERGPDCNFKHSLAEKDESISHGRQNTGRSKDCWFCLSSPNLESHLIISIGENYYCALAKGPLVQDHVLIIPVEHSPNTFSLAPEAEIELERFKSALKIYFKNQGKEIVFFEWVFKHGTHANLQAIAIPLSKAPAVQKIFNMAAEKLGFKFVALNISLLEKSLPVAFSSWVDHFLLGQALPKTPLGDLLSFEKSEPQRNPKIDDHTYMAGHYRLPPSYIAYIMGTSFRYRWMPWTLPDLKSLSDFVLSSFILIYHYNENSEGRKLLRTQFDRKLSFFYVELPEGTILSHSVEDNEKFPVQFGREVLAGLLNVPNRADWRNCKLSKEDEMKMAETFKKQFEEFDPTH